MFEQVNEIAVLVSAILAIAIGSIWYSPLLFGNVWIRSAGLAASDFEISRTQMMKLLMYAVTTNVVLLYVIAQFVALSHAYMLSKTAIAVFLILFFIATTANTVIWEKRPISYLLIHGGYTALVVFSGMTIIALWPW